MADIESFYRTIILNEYEKRAKVNPRYSRNSFCKFLGMSPAYFSKLILGKIMMSLDIADKISKKLNLSSGDREKILLSVAEEYRCHALYLIDPDLTQCDPDMKELNSLPRSRKKR